MQAQTRISKARRRQIFASWLPELTPPCQCCLPKIIECSCLHDPCDCEMDIDVVNPRTGKTCDCYWGPEEASSYFALLGQVLAKLDPINYRDPPFPSLPIGTLSMEAKLAAMEMRNLNGFHIKHPDDRSSDEGREGELVVVTGNGVKKRGGVGVVADSKHEARYGGERVKKSHRTCANI
jgi:hypothetical protein